MRHEIAHPLRILTWHVHGSYLLYLTQSPHTFYLPVKPGYPAGYAGKRGHFPWGDNVVDVPAERVRDLAFDCILFQSRQHWLEDQYEILSPAQRRLPRIYLEHDCPREHPVDQRHIVDDPDVLLVHVTHFNDLMWESGRTPTRVIDHGVMVPASARYSGERARGIAVVNGMRWRGRRAGADLFTRARHEAPLDLVGMQAEEMGGLGEIPLPELPAFLAHYRFFFHPMRYTSLGLAALEAMMVGLPVIAPATTEIVTVIENGISGYIATDITVLIAHMRRLIADPAEARRLGEGARRTAMERFNIARFARDWDDAFRLVTGARAPAYATAVPAIGGAR
jgi:hypothetical protein